MYSYFIRHKMDVTDKAVNELWDSNRIAIHFEDKRSLNPKDYGKSSARRAVSIFRNLEKNGG
jgi:hypothetical protein